MKLEHSETIFEFGGEGGSICISRSREGNVEKFLYEHDEFDPTDEGLEVNEKGVYSNFEEPFELIHKRYPWYELYILKVHDDYRDFIIDKLIEKLNEKAISFDYLKYSKNDLEQHLQIDLSCKMDNDKPIWTYANAE